jgi:Mitochondrial domain of unknown function (DUF1713)
MARSGTPPAAAIGLPRFLCPSIATLPPVRPGGAVTGEITGMGSVIKKRRKRMAKKKHRKLLRKTRVARRKAGK